jgi:hypothetical protein
MSPGGDPGVQTKKLKTDALRRRVGLSRKFASKPPAPPASFHICALRTNKCFNLKTFYLTLYTFLAFYMTIYEKSQTDHGGSGTGQSGRSKPPSTNGRRGTAAIQSTDDL